MSHQHIVHLSQVAVHEDKTRERPDTVNHFMALLSNEKIRRNSSQMDDWENSKLSEKFKNRNMVGFSFLYCNYNSFWGIILQNGINSLHLKVVAVIQYFFLEIIRELISPIKLCWMCVFWWCICLGKTLREKYQDTRPFRHLHSLNKVDSINR